MPEKNYAAIAARKIHKPSQIERSRKLLVYGRNKKGKTTFCTTAGIDHLLIVDPEHGTDTMVNKDPNVWPVEKWEDLDEVYKFLRTGKHDYKWVALDGLTRIHNMSLNFVMRKAEERDLDRQPGQVSQRDYGKAGEATKQLLINFHNMDIGLIITCQERMVGNFDDDEDAEGAMFVPDLPAGVRSIANAMVDVIGRLYVVKVKIRDPKTKKVVEKNQRRLWIAPHNRYDTGFRSDFEMPEYIKNPTVPKVVNLMLKGE